MAQMQTLYLYCDERLYNEILPEPEGNPEGQSQGIFRGPWRYLIINPGLITIITISITSTSENFLVFWSPFERRLNISVMGSHEEDQYTFVLSIVATMNR